MRGHTRSFIAVVLGFAAIGGGPSASAQDAGGILLDLLRAAAPQVDRYETRGYQTVPYDRRGGYGYGQPGVDRLDRSAYRFPGGSSGRYEQPYDNGYAPYQPPAPAYQQPYDGGYAPYQPPAPGYVGRPVVVDVPLGVARGGCYQGPLLAQADDLVVQAEAFLQVFGPTACYVPNGQSMLRTAQDLYGSAVAFRDALYGGAQPCDLRGQFQQVERSAATLANQVERVARGRTGPNIRQAYAMADLTSRIGQSLN